MYLGGYCFYGENIGRGAYGVVRKCRPVNELLARSHQPELVGKIVFQGPVVDERKRSLALEEARREAFILSSLKHPHIAELKDLDVGQGYILFVLKYERCGDLFKFLRDRLQRPMREPEAAHTFRQALEAIKFLHDRRIIHRDLKPENILVADFEQVDDLWFLSLKLTDFGLSKLCEDPMPNSRGSCHGRVGTFSYMAPEMYNGVFSYVAPELHHAVDYFSLGVILYYTVTLSYPGDGTVMVDQRHVPCPALSSSQASLDADTNNYVPARLQPLARGFLRWNPEERAEMTPTWALSFLGRHFDPVVSSATSSMGPSASIALSSSASSSSSSPNSVARTVFVDVGRDSSQAVLQQELRDRAVAQDLQNQELYDAAQDLSRQRQRQLAAQCDEDFAYAQSVQNKQLQEAQIDTADIVDIAVEQAAELLSPLIPTCSRTVSIVCPLFSTAARAFKKIDKNSPSMKMVKKLVGLKKKHHWKVAGQIIARAQRA